MVAMQALTAASASISRSSLQVPFSTRLSVPSIGYEKKGEKEDRLKVKGTSKRRGNMPKEEVVSGLYERQ